MLLFDVRLGIDQLVSFLNDIIKNKPFIKFRIIRISIKYKNLIESLDIYINNKLFIYNRFITVIYENHFKDTINIDNEDVIKIINPD